MSDVMHGLPFGQLMNWALTEYQTRGSVFGVDKVAVCSGGQALPIFGEKIETPFGPAAGPNTQLAQNIVAAYISGARFFELKTVQILDGEALAKCVAKPCITAGDEAYNCEWSTELTVAEAFDEYVKGWFACKLLAKELSLGDPDGFVFNMSVGYDLAGIQTPKIDNYINGMKNATGTDSWQACMGWALANLCRFSEVDEGYIRGISPVISRSITESTLHGCPPAEIEAIATYLMEKKGLHTYVKCNPTLLGYDFARRRLDALGYDYIQFDDHHFVEDLQWGDALPMFQRLVALGKGLNLEFGVKLSNTFPVDVAAGELPSQEMYMSGRALYPLTISLARRIATAFDGQLRISYSGGADVHNIKSLFDAGIWPITVATTILKPGGYQRLHQMSQALDNCGSAPFAGVDVAKVTALDDGVEADGRYRKPMKPLPSRAIDQTLPLLNCFTAPCRSGCPIEQDIPAYLDAVAQGDHQRALTIILQRNPLPFITGTICPHHCGDKCMRNYYEQAVHIRSAKLQAAQNGYAAVLPTLTAKPSVQGKKVAIVGGGPAGLAAAFLLSREGVDVTVFEKEQELGGIVRRVIPEFRIEKAAVDRDVALCQALGAKFQLGVEISSVQTLFDQGFTQVILACGAQKPGRAGLEYGTETPVIPFLTQAKTDPGALNLGSDVVVIGGGNTAMDAARAAKAIAGVERVRLVYRRTKTYMPADEEELELALADGVEFMELLAPVGVADGVLTCKVMELGAKDEKGRRAPVDTGRTVTVPATTVIVAVGESVDDQFMGNNQVAMERGRPVVDKNLSAGAVYVIGDARRGPATVVEAIADATTVVGNIVDLDSDKFTPCNIGDCDTLRQKKGVLQEPEAVDDRCLGCSTVCEVCADVCPNRANVAVVVDGQRQIVHVDTLCNECGNCEIFCPYWGGRPYRDKFTLFASQSEFDDSENNGYLPAGDGSGRCTVRLFGQVSHHDIGDPNCTLPEGILAIMVAIRTQYGYLIQ